MKHLLLTTIAAVVLVGCGPFFFVAHELIVPQNFSIHKAARVGHIEVVKKHLAAGVDVNAKDEGGVTPLQHAAYWGHKEIAELLIAKGTDVNAKDDGGRTPLDWAISNNHPETANLLRKHGGKTGEELKAAGK